ncbi:MAG: mechanosensitive ion channel family protein [Planctomycetota bacterium]
MGIGTTIYIVAVLVGGISLLGVLSWLIRRLESEQLEQVEEQEDLQAVRTRSPIRRPLHNAREAASQSVAFRFSIVRRFSVTAIALLWLALLSFPFLGGVPATVVSVIAGFSGIVLGIAAKPFIENLICGIVFTFSGCLSVGDTVLIDGNYGTIEDITMSHTIVKIWDWRRYVIPNSQMMNAKFLNLTLNDSYQWCRVEFWVSSDANLELVEERAVEVASTSPFFAHFENPRFWLIEMGKDALRCWVAAWAISPTHAWQLSNDIRIRLAKEFQAMGVVPRRFNFDIRSRPAAGQQPAGDGFQDWPVQAEDLRVFTPEGSAPPPTPQQPAAT